MRFATHNTLLLACTRVGRLRVATSTAVCCYAAGQTADAAPRIEVERKFQAPEGGVPPAVLAAGGTFLGEKRFSDAYWDTPECDLTRTDTWLRVRRMQADHEGQWELKLPVEHDAKRSGGERTVFTEVEGEAAVSEELGRLLPERMRAACATGDTRVGDGGAAAADAAGVWPGDGSGGLTATLRAAGLRPFAVFDTVRTRLRVGGASVDADEASFGHSVVEVEVMCGSAEEVPAAEAEISRVATAIGLLPLAPGSGGKLETFIRSQCPDVLAHLVDAGVLRA